MDKIVTSETPSTRAFARAKNPPKRVPVDISGQDVPDCPCELMGIDAGTLHIRSERQIPESSSIVVSLDHTQLSGVVVRCQPDREEWIISVALASRKRRLDKRIPQAEECAIAVIDDNRTDLRPCTIIDASPFGLGLRLSFPVKTGARVCVETESTMILGEVRHCQAKAEGVFTAGILVVDVVPDLRTQSPFSVMLQNLRFKLASRIGGRDTPATGLGAR